MPLPVAYQNQFRSVHVRGYWLPEAPTKAVILSKVQRTADRGPIFCHSAGFSYLNSEHRILDSINGSLVASCTLAEDDGLSMKEKATLSSISSPSMRHQKTWSFILTRMVLGEVLQQDPKNIQINREGKPFLSSPRKQGSIYCHATGSADLNSKHPNLNPINGSSVASCALAEDDPTLHFNVSHSGNLWIIAWSFDQEVGIDVQKTDETINYKAIMRQFFTEAERAEVNTVFDFFDLWTQKEAVLKLRGLSFAHMPKISTTSATLMPLEIVPEFKAHLAV